MSKLTGLSLLFLALTACSPSEPTIDIETYDRVNPIFGVQYAEIKVIGKADGVEVEDIIVNRGNCDMEMTGGGSTTPVTLRFGETRSFIFSAPCSAFEVTVVTDAGEWTWNY